MNSKQRILQALKKSKRGLTKQQLLKKCSVWNVGARINELRKSYDIETQMIKTINQFGEKVEIGRYVYKGER